MEMVKPCPFCGAVGDVLHHDGGWFGDDTWMVSCPNDMCGVAPWTDPFDTMEEAVNAWNKRAERTCRIEPRGHILTLSDGTELYESCCSECRAYIGEDDNYCPGCGAKVIADD